MTRTMILVVVATGAAGLAIGWFAAGPRAAPKSTLAHHVLKPSATAAAPSEPNRREFVLREEDVANDRETPAVAVDSLDRVVLAWAVQSGRDVRTLVLARSTDGGKTFDLPVPFRKVPIYRYASRSKGESVSYSTHVLPRLAATQDGLYLGWVEAIAGGPEVADYVARSTDGGKSFSEPVRTHGKNASKPGFTALSAAPDGSLLAAWLDGRNRSPQPFFAARPAGSEGFEPERQVYAGPSEGKGICPCCDLAAARLPDGSDVVAFRNSDSGFRDIWLARAPRGGAFGPAAAVAPEHWKFDGCPHDGPALALANDRLFVAWMSAHSGKNRVYVAGSPTSELAFSGHPLNAAAIGAQGHPKLASTKTGRLFAVWDESLDDTASAASHSGHGHGAAMTGSGRAVMLASAADDAPRFGPARAVSPRPGAFQLNPAIAVGPNGAIVVAWNEIDRDGKRVVFVRREPETEER